MERNSLEYRHNQTRILELLRKQDYALVVHMMRAGKTLPACQMIKELNEKTIIIAPPSAIPSWHKHLKDVQLENSNKITIVSTGILSSYDLDDIKRKYNQKYEVAVIDEIHKQRANSKIFKATEYLCLNAVKRVGLSATPFDTSMHELFYPMRLLDRGELFGKNKRTFHLNYCRDLTPYSPHRKWIIREDLVEPLIAYIHQFTTTYNPPEIDPPTFIRVRYPLTKTQRKWCRNIEDREAIPEIGNRNLDYTGGTRNQKIHQIYSGFIIDSYIDEWTESEVSNVITIEEDVPKWKIFKNLVSKLLPSQIVVWVTYIHEYHLVEKYLDGLCRTTRFSKKSLQRFKRFKDGEFDVIICHPKSASLGIDISYCDYGIYTSVTYSSIDKTQSSYRLSVFEGSRKKIMFEMVNNHGRFTDYHNRMKNKKENLENFYKKGKL